MDTQKSPSGYEYSGVISGLIILNDVINVHQIVAQSVMKARNDDSGLEEEHYNGFEKNLRYYSRRKIKRFRLFNLLRSTKTFKRRHDAV